MRHDMEGRALSTEADIECDRCSKRSVRLCIFKTDLSYKLNTFLYTREVKGMRQMDHIVTMHQDGVKIEVLDRTMVIIYEFPQAAKSQLEAWFDTASHLLI